VELENARREILTIMDVSDKPKTESGDDFDGLSDKKETTEEYVSN